MILSNHCPLCGSDTAVIDSRERKDVEYLYRRRKCFSCQHRYSTYELTKESLDELIAIKTAYNVIMRSIKGEYGV